MKKMFASLLTWAMISSFVMAAPWPRFRGPNGTGVAADKGIPVKWTNGDGLVWKAAVPGAGISSPVVWDDHIFLQSASNDGKERLLVCLKASDGSVRWSKSVPGDKGKTHPFNTLATSTPATDGERVYTVFWDGQKMAMHAYDFQGNLAWGRDLGGLTTQHGAGNSPIVHNGKVVFANEQDGSANLLALDVKTGKTVWQTPRKPFRASYSTPFLLDKPGNGSELIVASSAGVAGYEPNTGKEVWSWTWVFDDKPLRTVGSPVAGGGMIFATSGDGGGARHMVALKNPANGGKADLAWEKKTKGFPYVPTMIPLGDHLYFITDLGMAGCCVAKTGEIVYMERLGGKVMASPVLIDGKIYSVSEDGDVHVFTAATTFKLLAKNSLGEPVRASPAVADNRLYIRGKDHLFCIGKP